MKPKESSHVHNSPLLVHILHLHLFKIYLNINLPYTSVSHKYLSPSAFTTNIVNALHSPKLVPCATPILYFSISSSYLTTSTNHKASPYATSFSLVLLPLSPVTIFSAASCSPTSYVLSSTSETSLRAI
jgi:hypothetical protein